MEHFKTFLDTSTIHGLSWISSTRRWSRLFWIVVVFLGFTGCILLIQESFYNWQKHPIATTIETLPISEITFPNVTVCPPKHSFLNLNYDIVQSENLILKDSQRKELFDYALDVIQELFFEEVLKNLSKVDYPNRYYDWFHGYTDIRYPYNFNDQLNHILYTSM